MARGKALLPHDFMRKLERIDKDINGITQKVLNQGADFVLPKLKAKARSVVGKGTKYPSRSTGEAVDSIGKSPVKKNRRKGIDVKLGVADPRKRQPKNARLPLTNAMLLNIIEYGKKAVDQPPKPIVRPIEAQYKDQTLSLMARELDKEVGDL